MPSDLDITIGVRGVSRQIYASNAMTERLTVSCGNLLHSASMVDIPAADRLLGFRANRGTVHV